jgi:membrane-bound lytic murein transglycosylase D
MRVRRERAALGLAWLGSALLLSAVARGAGAAPAASTPASSARPTAAPASLAPLPAPVPAAGTASGANVARAPKERPAPAAPPKVARSNGKPAPKQRAAARTADDGTRRVIAGGPTVDDITQGVESPELRALREAERELFPPAMPPINAPWPNEMPYPLAVPEDAPHVHASGLPPSPPPSTPPSAEGGHDLSWLSRLTLPPGLPVRWDGRVVRYLEFFKDDPRGRQLFAYWLRRSGRYRDAIRRSLRKKSLPEDLLWLSMIESGFDPAARSPAGAVGLWQFMPDTGRLYGLSLDRWADQRMNVQAATDAAADFLSDLYRRFGSWELAIAAYNMGYGGVVNIVRKYNTNDFWSLSRLEGAVPWETTLYVPKLIAVAILTHNLATFGYGDVGVDVPTDTDEINVPSGTPLSAIASAAGCTTKEVEALNLELRAGRTPPAVPSAPPTSAGTSSGSAAPGDPSADAGYTVRVPVGKGALAAQNMAKIRHDQGQVERYVVKFGESLEQIALAHKVPVSRLVELNAIAQGEVVRGGTVLLVPRTTGLAPAGAPGTSTPQLAAKQVATVVVPPDLFVYPDRKRVFYRVTVGDTLPSIASALHVSMDELRRWNDLDPSARLQEGMTLQAFVPPSADLTHVAVLAENEARTVPAGSDEFFAYWEGVKGRKRITVTAKAGETLEQIGRRYQVSPAMMERINHRPRSEALKQGDTVVVHTPVVAAPTPPLLASAGPGTAPPAGPTPSAGPVDVDATPPMISIDSLPELP